MSQPATTSDKLDMVLMIVKSLEKKLDSCRGHCDRNTKAVWGEIALLRDHKSKLNGIETERKAHQEKVNVEAQKIQYKNMLWGAAIGAGALVLLELIKGIAPALVR